MSISRRKKAVVLILQRATAAIICTIFIILAFGQIRVKAATAESSAGIVTTSSTPLNIRTSASTSSAIISTVKKGTYITLIRKSGNWINVEYSNGKYGYCSASYITSVYSQPASVKLTSGYLNVRSGAGTSFSVKSYLQNGKTVLILSTSNGWSKILYNGSSTGYVYSSYLSSKTDTSNYKKLYVPDFKQTDSRWSGKLIGSSGKTIGQIGCTTTCLAMTESFRTNTTIYPSTMSARLSYSSTGSLYWPSNYTVTTTVSTSAIKNILNQGKPAIVGLRTSSNSTHWVVVTGYNGSVLYVNDPATASRTTLGQVFEKYPYFYKLAFYK